MLERIENFYLACLRVIVIVAATVALVVFIWACSQGLPFVAAQLGVGQKASPAAPSLDAFIAEQQPVTPAEADSTDITASNVKTLVPTKVSEAAKLLSHYIVSRKVAADPANLAGVLMARRGADSGSAARRL